MQKTLVRRPTFKYGTYFTSGRTEPSMLSVNLHSDCSQNKLSEIVPLEMALRPGFCRSFGSTSAHSADAFSRTDATAFVAGGEAGQSSHHGMEMPRDILGKRKSISYRAVQA